MLLGVLGDRDVRAMVSMDEAIAGTRAAFGDLRDGAFGAPVSQEHECGLMIKSVVHRPTGTSAVKLLTVDAVTAPLVSGVVTLLDAGARTELIAEAGAVTALRTGAISGLATDLLAADDVQRLVLIGAGAQGGDQVRAVRAVRPISEVTVVDADVRRAEALCQQLSDELPGVVLRVSGDSRATVGEADVVCCATSSPRPLFELEDLPPRVHVNAIGSFRPGMRELPRALLAEATVVVDAREAVLHEAGEVIDAVEAGVLAEDDLLELGDALDGVPDREPRTVFKTVGLAVQDWAVMRALAAASLTTPPITETR